MSKQWLGVDLGGTNVRVGAVREGEVIRLEKQRIAGLKREDQVLDAIIDQIARHDLASVAGIGVGVPGTVDSDGVVHDVQNLPGWDRVELARILSERFSLPVRVENDTNCFALGEYHHGEGKPYRSMIALNIGTGVAGGILVNGELYRGHNGGAGEFGTVAYRDSMMEHYCGGLFFLKQYDTDGGELADRAINGDSDAQEAFRIYGHHLGRCLQMILYAWDPEAIFLGGSVSHSWDLFHEELEAELANFSYQEVIRNLTLKVSRTEHVAVLGAAALIEYPPA
ncbi:MAG: ROK family protein [Balneolaceae bacterium]